MSTTRTTDVLSNIDALIGTETPAGDVPTITWAKDGQRYTATVDGVPLLIKRSGKFYALYAAEDTDHSIPVRTVAEGKSKAADFVAAYLVNTSQDVPAGDTDTDTDADESDDFDADYVPGTFDESGQFTPDEPSDVPAVVTETPDEMRARIAAEMRAEMEAQIRAQVMAELAATQAPVPATNSHAANVTRDVFEASPADIARELTEQALRTGRHPNATADETVIGYDGDEATRLGAELAGEIWQYFMTYMKFPDAMAAGYAGTLTLWVMSTHLYLYQGVTPYILVSSPTAGAGKSTLINIASRLIRHPAIEVNPTPAVIRSLAGDGYSLMIDECDELYASKDFKSILNAGYKRGGAVSRVKGKSVVRDNVFGPKLFAGIGREGAPLQGALLDRCIQIWLERAMPGERPLFDLDMIPETMRERIVHWSRLVVASLERSPANMPAFGTPRSAELWRPLIAIADTLGGTWGKDARLWAIDLESKKEGQADPNVQILSDVRDVLADWLTAHPTETMIATDELLELRNSANGRQYADKLTGVSFGKRMKQFGIVSTPRKGVRFYVVGNGQGGFTAELERVFARYCDGIAQA